MGEPDDQGDGPPDHARVHARAVDALDAVKQLVSDLKRLGPHPTGDKALRDIKGRLLGLANSVRVSGRPTSVEAIETYGGCWPADQPFPFTPEECQAIMMGYAVRPGIPLTEATVLALPGKFETEDRGTRVVLWRS